MIIMKTPQQLEAEIAELPTIKDLYRIEERNELFTVQRKWIMQQKPFNPKNKLLEVWVDLDENGCISLCDGELSGRFKQYESMESAQIAMDGFIKRERKREIKTDEL